MIDEHIQDGDYVIIEQREDAHNGELVIALIDGENATLKKFYREDDKIRLQPANPALEPIWVKEDRIMIQGVVVGIMRKYTKTPAPILTPYSNQYFHQKFDKI